MFFRSRPHQSAESDARAELDQARETIADLRVELSHAHWAADQIKAENEKLRQDVERLRAGLPPGDWPPPLTAQERQELHWLRAQNAALDERLHQLTMASIDRDFAGAEVAAR